MNLKNIQISFIKIINFFKANKPLVIILAVAALAQAAFFAINVHHFGWGSEAFTWGQGDPQAYLRLGLNLLKYKAYVWTTTPRVFLDVFRLPLMPFYIAATYKLFGNFWAIVILQQLIFVLPTMVVIWMIFSELFGRRAAFWGGLFTALDLQRITLVNQLSAESIFLLTFFLFIFCVLRFVKKIEEKKVGRPAFKLMALAGLFLGLAVLARGFVLTLIAATSVYLLYFVWRKLLTWRQWIISAALLASVTLLTVAPWALRNYYHFGVLKVSSTMEYVLYTRHTKRIFEYELKKSNISSSDLKELTVQMREDDFKKQNGLENLSDDELQNLAWSFQYGGYEMKIFYEVVKAHLGDYMMIWARRIPGWLVDNGLGEELAYVRNYFYPGIVKFGIEPVQALWFGRFILAGVYLAIAAGFVFRRELFLKRLNALLFLIMLAGIFAVSGAMVYNPRIKMPIDFFTYHAFAFIAVQYLFTKKEKH